MGSLFWALGVLCAVATFVTLVAGYSDAISTSGGLVIVYAGTGGTFVELTTELQSEH